MWTTQADELVCPVCEALDGEEWTVDDPGLQTPPDDTHDNCRCYLDIVPAEETFLTTEEDELTA